MESSDDAGGRPGQSGFHRPFQGDISVHQRPVTLDYHQGSLDTLCGEKLANLED